MPPPKPSESLAVIANAVQWYVQYSLVHFLPEMILGGGFLAVILLNALARSDSGQRTTVYLSILVLALAGCASAFQWHALDPLHPKDWKPGTMIFPYTQTLFAPDVQHGEAVSGFGMAVVDNFAVFFKLLVSLCGILVLAMSLSSRELLARSRRFGDYSSLLLGMTVGLFLMPASTDLIMMYLSLELVSIAGYVLTGFSRDTTHGPEASLKYLLFGALSSGLMIYGFSLIYGLTGATQIIAIRQVLALSPAAHAGANLLILWLATVLVLAGMCYKISAVPFHFWTPDVYEGAPLPVAAFLSVASKAAGMGLIIRFLVFTFPIGGELNLPLINWPIVIAALSVITMTVGNLAALLQSNLRRLLAYSSIAHAGYMLAGLAVNGPAGIVAIMVYLATYLFMQLGAFYCIMLIENKIHSEEIDDYRGLGGRSPLVASALVIFLVSLTGIPLTAGFIGKFYLFTALLTPNPVTHNMPFLWLAVAAILNAIVSLYYYLRIVGAMFLKRPLREAALESLRVAGAGAGRVAGAVPGTGAGGEDATGHATIRFALSQRVLLFAFVIPVIALGVYFQPLIDFASGVMRFFNFENIKY